MYFKYFCMMSKNIQLASEQYCFLMGSPKTAYGFFNGTKYKVTK